MKLAGVDAEKFLHEQISGHLTGTAETLGSYDPFQAALMWRETMRAVEEFINLPDEIGDEELLKEFLFLSLMPLEPVSLMRVVHGLEEEFDSNVASRFKLTATQTAAMAMGLQLSGYPSSAELANCIGAVSFFQSRRRQMMALQYALPSTCRGTKSISRVDIFNIFLRIFEISFVALTGLYRHLFLIKALSDYEIEIDSNDFQGNFFFETLSGFFLEPERAAITEISINSSAVEALSCIAERDHSKIFSANELCRQLAQMEVAFAEFNLSTGTLFGALNYFIVQCLSYCKDDYHIDIPAEQLATLMKLCKLPAKLQHLLVDGGTGYSEFVNSFSPFLVVGSQRISTVTWLSRFACRWKSICLDKVKRYQVRAGFMFEDEVKAVLFKAGFFIADIRRIDRKEFDVIAIKGGAIFNVQCKNNLVDLSNMELNPSLAARYNRRLEKYYEAALKKEEGREYLLKIKLGISDVKHFVVSKFPVATRNPRIVAFREIGRIGKDASV